MENPLNLTQNETKSICLPQLEDDVIDNEKLTVSGWGFTTYTLHNDSSPDQLMVVDVDGVERRRCNNMLYDFQMNHFGHIMRNASINMICAGVREGGKDACRVRILYYYYY